MTWLSTTRRPSAAVVMALIGSRANGRDDPVVEVRLPVDDEPLDTGDVGRHVDVAAGQRSGLGVVEITGEWAALKGSHGRPFVASSTNTTMAMAVATRAARRAASPPSPAQAEPLGSVLRVVRPGAARTSAS